MKIGRSNNVLKRLSNLQTGTFGQLILHALEPGGSEKKTIYMRNLAAKDVKVNGLFALKSLLIIYLQHGLEIKFSHQNIK